MTYSAERLLDKTDPTYWSKSTPMIADDERSNGLRGRPTPSPLPAELSAHRRMRGRKTGSTDYEGEDDDECEENGILPPAEDCDCGEDEDREEENSHDTAGVGRVERESVGLSLTLQDRSPT